MNARWQQAGLALGSLGLLTGCAGPSETTTTNGGSAVRQPAVAGVTASAAPGQAAAAGSASGTVPVTSVAGSAAASSTGSGPAPIAAPALPKVAQTLGTGTCRRLPAATAARLLAAGVRASADRRLVDGRRTQLDGCVYTTATGARLSYVVWQLPRTVTAGDTKAVLPPAGGAARRFETGLPLGAGVLLDVAGFATAQVSVGSGRQLVEVNVAAAGADASRSAALGAAKALLG